MKAHAMRAEASVSSDANPMVTITSRYIVIQTRDEVINCSVLKLVLVKTDRSESYYSYKCP